MYLVFEIIQPKIDLIFHQDVLWNCCKHFVSIFTLIFDPNNPFSFIIKCSKSSLFYTYLWSNKTFFIPIVIGGHLISLINKESKLENVE